MKDLFRNPVFVRMFIASFGSQMGTIIGNMAFAFYLLDHFSSQPGLTSLAEMMYSLPTLAVFFIVGVVADRFDRQHIAEYTGWIRSGLTILLIGSVLLKFLPLTFAILFLRSAVSKFFGPAEMGLVQGVLGKEQYVLASGLNQTVFGVFMLFGASLGAVAYTHIGVIGAMILDFCGFLLSATLIRSCRISLEVRQPSGPAHWRELNVKSTYRDFREGMLYVLRNKLLLSLIGGFLLFGFINGGFAVLPMYTMKYHLAPNNYKYFVSMFSIFLGIGFLGGSAIGGTLIKALKSHRVLIGGLLCTTILTLVMSQVANPWVFLSLVLVTGLVLAPVNIVIGGWLPEIVEPDKMGRVNAWTDPILMLGQSVSLGFISLFYPKLMSLDFIYIALAIFMFAAFVYYLIALPRMVQKNKAHVPEKPGDESLPVAY
ncbi:MFS transporter [Gorillibacterium massiliense]|uniref:MFS transporter n=1 Tax=Gorillibacterium massiliense TaxID=1280390 RepID=UPI0004ADF6A3|nr:MFS transporter [Gorillibacterium massiliense]